MATRIECINKTNRSDPHDRIDAVGGAGWKLTEDEAIAKIESGQDSFYVEEPAGHRVDVIVASREGSKYLKTTADGEQPDNLLSLPECP